ncbi:TetR/AcrR family transcriptional regulator [Tomitella biformata]|uniref:TetR/AcrR family transcriptional regulator n=1 Tax=Tomitella biformata TaxID=630403 RepID=UPI000466A5EB|nr:TetR/AcrR family transcriptional regulator [Tomitella biformata]
MTSADSAERTRPRRKYAPRLTPELRRAQLLDAAFEVAGREGFHQLSMEAVAAQADVGKPVLYTVFRTRTDLVAALLDRERERAVVQVLQTLPTDLAELGPSAAYAATVTGFIRVVLENPVRWRLILTPPDNAPGEYREHLRAARSSVLAQAELLAHAAADLDPSLARLDPELLAHTMMSFAEMVGRLAISDPESYTRERLSSFAAALVAAIAPQP